MRDITSEGIWDLFRLQNHPEHVIIQHLSSESNNISSFSWSTHPQCPWCPHWPLRLYSWGLRMHVQSQFSLLYSPCQPEQTNLDKTFLDSGRYIQTLVAKQNTGPSWNGNCVCPVFYGNQLKLFHAISVLLSSFLCWKFFKFLFKAPNLIRNRSECKIYLLYPAQVFATQSAFHSTVSTGRIHKIFLPFQST